MTRRPIDPAGASEIAAVLRPRLPLALGTLRVWGDWFGRPMDNIHTAVGVEAHGGVLTLAFDQGETLSVEAPADWSFDPDAPTGRLRIVTAARVTWEWFAYGRPRAAEHRHRVEHRLEDGRVAASSTADWYRPTFDPDPSLPAVEFL
jgi:hypothetical protein